MDVLLQQVKTLLENQSQVNAFLILIGIMTVGSLVLAGIGRFIFGKNSVLSLSVASALGIIFTYVITVVCYSSGLDLSFWVSPLPFVSLEGDTMHIFPIATAGILSLCGEVLNMIILAFLVNLINRLMPKGKNLLVWFLFRILSVILGMILFTLAIQLLNHFLPQGFLLWAPVILLALLVVLLLVGAFKGLVGTALTAVNPLVAFLYTFFFADLIGKMLTRAMLTTVFLGAFVYALNYLGITAVAIGLTALLAYIPLVLLLMVLWFIVSKLL